MASKPPTAPQVPLQAVQSLVPRLSTTINDIDALKAQIAAGHADASMPSWDTLLQRYSLLLGRIHSINQYISQPAPAASVPGPRPPPPPAAGPSSVPAAQQPPLLSSYLVHPLHPLPADAGPLANDLMFQVLSTQAVAGGEAGASGSGGSGGSGLGGSGVPGSAVGPGGSAAGSDATGADARMAERAPAELARMDGGALAAYARALGLRREREARRAQALLREIVAGEDEVDWAMRVGDDGEGEGGDGDGDGAGAGAGAGAAGGAGQGGAVGEDGQGGDGGDGGDDDDDDLFGEDEDGDAVMAPAAAPAPEPKMANPREGWTLTDYLRYMEKGVAPGAT